MYGSQTKSNTTHIETINNVNMLLKNNINNNYKPKYIQVPPTRHDIQITTKEQCYDINQELHTKPLMPIMANKPCMAINC